MRVRKMDDAGDMVFGNGLAAFWRDAPEGPAQVVGTRLRLYAGEWFLDTTAGTPWNTEVLGKYTSPVRDAVIRERILGTPGVTGIVSYASSFDPNTRKFAAAATIDTAYGHARIEEPV